MNKKLLVLDVIFATVVAIVGVHLVLAVVPGTWAFCAKDYANGCEKNTAESAFESK